MKLGFSSSQEYNIIIWSRQVSTELVRKMYSFKEQNNTKREREAVANLISLVKWKAARRKERMILGNCCEEQLQTKTVVQ